MHEFEQKIRKNPARTPRAVLKHELPRFFMVVEFPKGIRQWIFNAVDNDTSTWPYILPCWCLSIRSAQTYAQRKQNTNRGHLQLFFFGRRRKKQLGNQISIKINESKPKPSRCYLMQIVVNRKCSNFCTNILKLCKK